MSQRRGVDVRLAWVAGAAWAGVLAGLNVPDIGKVQGTVLLLGLGILSVAVLGSVALGLAVTAGVVSGGWRTAAVTMGTCLVGFLLGTQTIHVYHSSALAQAAEQGAHLTFTAKVISDPKQGGASWNEDTWTARVQGDGAQAIISSNQPQEIQRGAQVQVSGLVRSLDDAQPPLAGVVRALHVRMVTQPSGWQQATTRLKEDMSQVADRFGGRYSQLITGMAVGDDRGLNPDVHQAMLTSSLTHLTAVSGSHIAISLAVIRALLPGARGLRAALTVLFLVVLGTVVGWTPSVLRASLMATLALWGLMLRRGSQPLAALSAVVAATVLVSPWSAASLGFSLSVVATAGILSLGMALMKLKEKVPLPDPPYRKVAVALWDAVAIAVSAQVATLPVLALINPWLPVWGVAANLLVAPIVAPLTLLGLGVAVTVWPLPFLATWLAWLAAPLATWLGLVALWVASWPFARFPWPQGPAGFALAAAAGALSVGGILWLVRLAGPPPTGSTAASGGAAADKVSRIRNQQQ